jgi:hypothetical protein
MTPNAISRQLPVEFTETMETVISAAVGAGEPLGGWKPVERDIRPEQIQQRPGLTSSGLAPAEVLIVPSPVRSTPV